VKRSLQNLASHHATYVGWHGVQAFLGVCEHFWTFASLTTLQARSIKLASLGIYLVSLDAKFQPAFFQTEGRCRRFGQIHSTRQYQNLPDSQKPHHDYAQELRIRTIEKFTLVARGGYAFSLYIKCTSTSFMFIAHYNLGTIFTNATLVLCSHNLFIHI